MKKAVLIIAAFAVLGGLAYWNYASRQPAGKTVGTQQEVFLDVRTDQEWQAGHLDGAVHFDVERLKAGATPDLSKNAPIAVYCRTGNRSGQAMQILLEKGFTNVRNAGGLTELAREGKLVCTGPQVSCR